MACDALRGKPPSTGGRRPTRSRSSWGPTDPTAADARWWATESNCDATDYQVDQPAARSSGVSLSLEDELEFRGYQLRPEAEGERDADFAEYDRYQNATDLWLSGRGPRPE